MLHSARSAVDHVSRRVGFVVRKFSAHYPLGSLGVSMDDVLL